jgi:hypothetical protein
MRVISCLIIRLLVITPLEYDVFLIRSHVTQEADYIPQVFMAFHTMLGMELLASTVSKSDTVLTRPFCSFHGIVLTLVSLRYDSEIFTTNMN